MTITDQIQMIIEEDINPALASHNGFIVLDAIEGLDDEEVLKVFVTFYGGCEECPSKFTSTLETIQNHMRIELERDNLELINTETQ